MCLEFNKQDLCSGCRHCAEKTLYFEGGRDYYSDEEYGSSSQDIHICKKYAGKDPDNLEQSQWLCPKYQKAKKEILKELRSHKWQGTMKIGTRDELHIIDFLDYYQGAWWKIAEFTLLVETPDHVRKIAKLCVMSGHSVNSCLTPWMRKMGLQLMEDSEIAPLHVGETFDGLCNNKDEDWTYLAALYGHCHNPEEAKDFDIKPYQKLFPDTDPTPDYEKGD
jgi:hypothetical protein